MFIYTLSHLCNPPFKPRYRRYFLAFLYNNKNQGISRQSLLVGKRHTRQRPFQRNGVRFHRPVRQLLPTDPGIWTTNLGQMWFPAVTADRNVHSIYLVNVVTSCAPPIHRVFLKTYNVTLRRCGSCKTSLIIGKPRKKTRLFPWWPQ
jgi:hypothetical protein